MKIKGNALAFALVAIFSLSLSAQNESNKIEFGFSVNQFHNDFGIGVHAISPYFLHSKVAVRLGANYQWLEHLNGTETTWTPYQNIQLGLRARNPIVDNKLFIYGEGGVITIIPNSKFSANSTEFGGYGLFGFEFKPSQKFAYFIESGGVGSGAKADKLFSTPIYSNGFVTQIGFRIGL